MAIPKLYTIKETAQILRISQRHLERLIALEKITVRRNGRRVVIEEISIEEFINSLPSFKCIQFLSQFPLGYSPVDVVCGVIPEPNIDELIGFLFKKRRFAQIAKVNSFLPLGAWLPAHPGASTGDLLDWSYLRFAAAFLSKQPTSVRRRYKMGGVKAASMLAMPE